jgi:predicted nucleic acid-binding protein
MSTGQPTSGCYGRLTPPQSRALDPFRMVEVDLEAALEIADTHGIYAYDAYVIGTALRQRCALLALDKGLLRAARAAGCRVIEVSK